MPRENIVKARRHHGSKSMDLTIPAGLIAQEEILDGDLFKLVARREGGHLLLEYRRIYSVKNE